MDRWKNKNDLKGLIVLSIKIFIPLLSGITHSTIYPSVIPFTSGLYMLHPDIYMVINHTQLPSRPLYLWADLTPITM